MIGTVTIQHATTYRAVTQWQGTMPIVYGDSFETMTIPETWYKTPFFCPVCGNNATYQVQSDGYYDHEGGANSICARCGTLFRLSAVKSDTTRAELIRIPAGERDSDVGYWLCDNCASLICATHTLVRQITREIQIYKDGLYSRTEHRSFGVWKEYRTK